MFAVAICAAVRRFVFIEGESRRGAARVFGLSPDTIAKMGRYSAPPGDVRSKARDPSTRSGAEARTAGFGHRRESRSRQDGAAQTAHKATWSFEPPRIEHGYVGGDTVVKDYVRLARTRSREVFVPLVHPPGHARGSISANASASSAVCRSRFI